MDFSQVKRWIIKEGECTIVYDSEGSIIWKRSLDPSWDLKSEYNIASSGSDINFNVFDTDYVGGEISSNVDWITFYDDNHIYGTSGFDWSASGQTPSNPRIVINKNTSTSSRFGEIYLKRDGVIIASCTITQAAALSAITWNLTDQTIRSLGYGIIGDFFDVTINNPESEDWQLESSESWLQFNDGSDTAQIIEGSDVDPGIMMVVDQNHGSQRTCQVNLNVKINGVYQTIYTCTITQKAGKPDPTWDLTNQTFDSSTGSNLIINVSDPQNQGWSIASDSDDIYFGTSGVTVTRGTGNKTVTATVNQNTTTSNKKVNIALETTVDGSTYTCEYSTITIPPYSYINCDDVLYLAPNESTATFTIDSSSNLTSAQKVTLSDPITCSISGKTLTVTTSRTSNNTGSSDWDLGSIVISNGVKSKTVKIVKQALVYKIVISTGDGGSYEMSKDGSKSVNLELDPATSINITYTGNVDADVDVDPQQKRVVDGTYQSPTVSGETIALATNDDVTPYLNLDAVDRTSEVEITVLGFTNTLRVTLNIN